ncbi:MAG: flagellar basal body-associated FliL family protein [Nitrospirae bacterium]|jgi:flagellar FliL protein|uniref:Flagellar protein FliL n=1 Tax=Leptospirillum ferrodiazotrophum TaxID=412449 RepID=C6HWM6_9BACT|nr:MAG: flagellar basal body-associated protein FliL [Leptospirillum ferrodiazotrophum]MCL5954300.1 flagellar basal body-associated FliL family protein [Nitrospirota bacterium]
MAEEEGEEQKEEKKGSKKIIIIAAAILLLLAGGGGFFFLHHKKAGARKEGEHHHQMTPKEMEKMIKEHPIVDLKPFVVNLSGPQGAAPQYLKVRIALKLDKALTAKEIEYRLPEIQSAILILLGAQTADAIQTTGGKLALKDAIRHRVNSRLDSGKVTDVYFTEFVVQ